MRQESDRFDSDLINYSIIGLKTFFDVLVKVENLKVIKSNWRMPWLSVAMKDVISGDKLRGGAHNLRSVDFRRGQPTILKV